MSTEEETTEVVDTPEGRPRIIARKKGERLHGSSFHWFDTCVRIAPALADPDNERVVLDDQTIDLLNLKLCANCERQNETDPSSAIVSAISSAVNMEGEPDPTLFVQLLGEAGFEVRPKRKPREPKAKDEPKAKGK